MSRKERRAAKHAAGRGKGRPTPKNTPGTMTRDRQMRLQARRSDSMLKGGVDRALEAIRAAGRGDDKALELLARQAGGVILDPKEKR